MKSYHMALLPVLLLTASCVLAVSSAYTKSCRNVPLSFSTTVDLLASRRRTKVGSVTVSLEDGILHATYSVDSSCKLTDSIHVNLVSTSSNLGITKNPAPGQFPCKRRAYGSSQSIYCPISKFSIDDCCADELRLFLHGVVVCNRKEDTVFAGSGTCKTRRWCNFEDVPIEIGCDLCNECSSSDAACVPVMNGLTPPGCDTEACQGNNPTSQSCQHGMCVTDVADPCPLCQECKSGSCSNLADGSTPAGCNDETCDGNTPTFESCQSGSCVTTDRAACSVCEECMGGSCSSLADGSTPTGCDDETCDGNTPTFESCQSGSCVTTDRAACSVCEECMGGSCSNLADGSTPTGCDDETCDGNTPTFESCQSGSCVTTDRAACSVCEECMSGSCSNRADGSTPTGCDDETCDGNTPTFESCQSGSCVTTDRAACSVCEECMGGSCSNRADGSTPTGCDDETCDGNTPTFESCQSGSCVTTDRAACSVCEECMSGSCSAIADGSTPTGCDDETCDGNTPTFESCQSGSCVTTDRAACSVCEECMSGSCSAVADGSTPTGCDDETCDGNTPTFESCQSGSCVTTDRAACAVCEECMSGSCSAVADGSTPTGCDDETCDGNTPTFESCQSGSCVTTDRAACAVCEECTSGSCSAIADGSTPTGCDGKECVDAITPGQYECIGGSCELSALAHCDECDLCDDVSVTCMFDPTSPTKEVCSTCGEQCTLQGDGTGACVDRCGERACIPGHTDDQDQCVGCVTDADCADDEDCINNVCEPSADCSTAKRTLCDLVFQDLSQTNSNSGKCCPSSSNCVRTVLNLVDNSVCSTECGQCNATDTAGSTDVSQIYCVFGNTTSPELEAANLPSCAELAANIPNDCNDLDVC